MVLTVFGIGSLVGLLLIGYIIWIGSEDER